MSEQAQQNNQQMIVIGLAVIAILLAAIVGVLIWQQNKAIPAPTSTSQAPVTQDPAAAATGAPAGMGAATGETVEFDPATATKVPAGTEPEAYVKSYYEACDAGDYAKAYALLPKDKQASYGDANAFGEQLKGYGITGYELEPAKVDGDTATITAWQQTPMGAFGYTWEIVKVDGEWVVKSRNQSGMK